MDLEHITQIPYNGIHKQFYQYENGGKLHQTEYKYFKIDGTDLILASQMPCSGKIIAEECPKGYTNSF